MYGECGPLALRAVHGDLRAHHLQDAESQGQAQAVPLRGVGGVALVEFFKDMGLRLLRDPAAGVGHGDRDGMGVRGLPQRDAAARPGEFEGVGQEVVPHQLHQAGVRLDGGPVLQLRVKGDLLFLPDRLKGQGAVAQLAAQVIGLPLGGDLLALQLVELQDIGNQGGEAACAAQDGGEAGVALLLRQIWPQKQLRVVLDGGQRGLDLVGDIGDKVSAHGLDAAQLRHHFVEVQDHHVQVVVPVGGVERRNIDGEIAVGHLVRRLGQHPHGLVIGPGDLAPGEQRQAHGHQRPVGRGNQDLDCGVPVGVFVDQRDQSDMDAGHQEQRHQIKGKEGGRKPRLQPPPFSCPHFSTAL